MIITISGKAGSGKGTVSKILAEKLGYERIAIGEIKRKLAEDMGIDILEFNKIGEQPDKAEEFDLKYEEYQKSLDPNANIIIDSRMGFYCQPKAFKIFLDVEDAVSAKRIMDNHRTTDRFQSLEEAIQEVKERNETDTLRYKKLYKINYTDTTNFDFVLNTSNMSIDESVNAIISAFEKFQKTTSFHTI